MGVANWWGVVNGRGVWNPKLVAGTNALADAARAGKWSRVFEVLDGSEFCFTPEVNTWRAGGSSWFASLHRAACLGAPISVVTELLDRGGWTSLRDSWGRRPADIARERSHHAVAELIEPSSARRGELREEDVAAMNRHLADVVDGRARMIFDPTRIVLRHVDVTLLFEDAGPSEIWFPIPGMYGGFHLTIEDGAVRSDSWIRVVGGSGQRHIITPAGARLVEEGFV